MSKIRTAYKVGMKAYKLGKKSRFAYTKASIGSDYIADAARLRGAAQKAYNRSRALGDSSLKNIAKSPFSFNKSKRRTTAAKAATQLGSSASYKKIGQKAFKKSKLYKKKGISLSARLRGETKIDKMSGAVQAAYYAGKIPKRVLGPAFATAGGIDIANRRKKRKPMSAATKAKISRALKGRKRK